MGCGGALHAWHRGEAQVVQKLLLSAGCAGRVPCCGLTPLPQRLPDVGRLPCSVALHVYQIRGQLPKLAHDLHVCWIFIHVACHVIADDTLPGCGPAGLLELDLHSEAQI